MLVCDHVEARDAVNSAPAALGVKRVTIHAHVIEQTSAFQHYEICSLV